jgi:hypothetical protein
MLRVESFRDDADPAALGLAPPHATITVEDDAGTHTLLLGNADDTGVAAKTDAGPVHLGADAADLTKLDGLAYAKLVPVRKATVDTLDVQLGDATGRFLKSEDEWKDATGAASTVPDGLLSAIEAATADRSAPPPELGATWGHVTLAEGTTRTETVTIGQELPTGGRAAKDAAGGPTFQVPAATLTALAAALK